MSQRPLCTILSFDYCDFDVFLNVSLFYKLAGFDISQDFDSSRTTLLVALRGLPNRVFSDFHGVVHVYDYVKELSYTYSDYFPNADLIYIVSPSDALKTDLLCRYIHAYLPVFPSLWQLPRNPPVNRPMLPVHIANYKPIADDPYQHQLIELITTNKIMVYGDKWEKVSIATVPLSYYSANRMLSCSYFCYGLMYPYQRGSSLSGRMWQAPIHGCLVLSELGTNIFNCPGVLEVSDYRIDLSSLQHSPGTLREDASSFWLEHTIKLASSLDLTLAWHRHSKLTKYYRSLLMRQHLEFSWARYTSSSRKRGRRILRSFYQILSP